MTGSFVLAVLIVIVYAFVEYKKAEDRASATMYVYCDKDGNLTLRKRNSIIGSVIKVEKIIHFSTSYHPANYVYTGATVGGVTTDGITKTGDYTSLDGYATDKYRLVYREKPDSSGTTITKIKLADKTWLEDARKHKEVSQFLQGDTLELVHKNAKDKYSSEDIAIAIKQGNMSLAAQLLQYNTEAHSLNKSECQAVLSWLCNRA